ncbi:GNAT family N-acetyltransferase [Brevibacillus brevis]|uniref:GNAT family N-acetyltransferase n=1 Tax=Brevibacillus brevis TaxID=1393 RepID=UPI0007D8BE26|nr:GNAT family N-acetyltransferase [Brevibacillus brevis]
MIHRLEPNDYAKIRTLLSPENVNDLTIQAIINGTNRGAIFVDDVEQPRTALVDQTGVSACLSCCVHERDHEISVETYEEADMNKGFATLACVAYLEHCMEHGLTPHWTTLETNEESVRLGTKLGFERKEKCKILEFEY